ncbi:MAG: DNA polymerase III subunit delta [Lachnospiraceae bacterium]|nr:DNA polymerase III subunit delta [Lachnospiraceae bacterium]
MYFSDIIGQEHIVSHLQKAIKAGKVSHAYIIQGDEGSGKRMLAATLAATLLCEEGGTEPCGICPSCKRAFTRNNPDIRYVVHEKAAISVKEVREQLVNDVMVKPYSGRYKVYIIDEAEKMNEAAQNAILKTIEEPPEYVVIMLLTVNSKLFLQTILSRCVLLNLRPVKKPEIIRLLVENHGVSPYLAAVAADFSDGVPGRAINYATSDEFISLKDEVTKILKRAPGMNAPERYELIKDLAGRKKEIPDMIPLMRLWFRDLLVEKTTKGGSPIIFSDEERDIISQAEQNSLNDIAKKMEAVETLKYRLENSINLEVSLELFLKTIR